MARAQTSSPPGAVEVGEALARRLAQCNTLPSLPAAAARIVELGRDPSAGMADVAEVVKIDPALAAKILRMANSPLYAQRRHCESFQQALVLLGLNATLTLALTFSLVTSFRESTASGLDYKRVWRRSLLAATAARVLAGHFGLPNGEEAFLGALLQDIGMLALDRAWPELYDPLGEGDQDHDVIASLERAHLERDHADVGAWLLAKWNLPVKLQRAVALSHRLEVDAADTPSDEHLLARVVALSGPVADLWMSSRAEDSLEALQGIFSQVENMDGPTLSLLVEKVAAAVPDVEQLFEMSITDARRSEWILQEAREIIVLRNLQMVQESARLREVAATLQAQANVLEEKSRRDNLTGAFNRGHLDEVLADWFADHNKVSLPLSAVFIDLDNFKQVNDRHGHHLGDKVLVGVTKVLTTLARSSDVVARYGGEEFVMVLPGCDTAGARVFCERLLDAFRRQEFELDSGNRLSVTVSMGVATHDDHERFDSAHQLLRSADQALYEAKQAGKNRFVEYARTSNAA